MLEDHLILQLQQHILLASADAISQVSVEHGFGRQGLSTKVLEQLLADCPAFFSGKTLLLP